MPIDLEKKIFLSLMFLSIVIILSKHFLTPLLLIVFLVSWNAIIPPSQTKSLYRR